MCSVVDYARREAQVDEAARLYQQGWSLRAVGRHLDMSADKGDAGCSTSGAWRSVIAGRIGARVLAS